MRNVDAVALLFLVIKLFRLRRSMKILRIEEKAVRYKTRDNKGFQVLHPAAFDYFEKGYLEKGRSHKYIKREPYTFSA